MHCFFSLSSSLCKDYFYCLRISCSFSIFTLLLNLIPYRALLPCLLIFVLTFKARCGAKGSIRGILAGVDRLCSKALLDASEECAPPMVFSSSLPPSLDLVQGRHNGASPPALWNVYLPRWRVTDHHLFF